MYGNLLLLQIIRVVVVVVVHSGRLLEEGLPSQEHLGPSLVFHQYVQTPTITEIIGAPIATLAEDKEIRVEGVR